MIAHACRKGDESLFTPRINKSSSRLRPEERLRIAQKVQDKHCRKKDMILRERSYLSRSPKVTCRKPKTARPSSGGLKKAASKLRSALRRG